MNKKYLILILFISITTNGISQSARKYSNEFMNIGVDAAALAMSGAVSATSNDVNSGYWSNLPTSKKV